MDTEELKEELYAIYLEGYKFAENGGNFLDCPYKKGTIQRKSWNDGYWEFQEEEFEIESQIIQTSNEYEDFKNS